MSPTRRTGESEGRLTITARLITLGGAELRGDDGDAPLLGIGKPLALLVFLSAAPGRKASRSSLISRFWSDLEPDAAKHALRQTLWYLRRRTIQLLVVPAGEILTLGPTVGSDRDDLLAASTTDDHAKVVELYRGPFLPSFAAPGSAGFEEWAALERRRLLEVFRHSADGLTRQHLASGHAQQGIDLARRIRDEDVNDERGWRLLLEALTSAGDVLGARAESQALEQLAERDEIELQPATRASIKAAHAAHAASVTSDGGTTRGARGRVPMAATLVGREAAFSTLLRGWEDAKGGKLVHVHVSARAGLGKTRLLRDVASRIRGMRGRVVSAGGTIGTRDIAYEAASELAAGLCLLQGKQGISPATSSILVALNPTLSTYFGVPPRHTAIEDTMRARTAALAELATAVAFEQPVAVFLDDIHWWDASSLQLVTALTERLRDAKMLLVTASRPEARALLPMTRTGTRQVELEPLDAGQVDELVLSIAELPDEPWAATFSESLCSATRGSPLLALELLQLLEQRELLRRDAGTWFTLRPDALADELRNGNVLRARLEDMERADWWLLTLFAVAGTALPHEVLIDASELPASEVAMRLAALETRGLIMQHRHDWNLAHDEILEELQTVMTPEAAKTASARVGRALVRATPFSESVARHAYRLLRDGGDRVGGHAVFRRFAGEHYAVGDRRSVLALAREFLGPTATLPAIADAVSAVPWSWRLGIVSRTRRVAAFAGAVATLTFAVLAMVRQPAPPPPDAVLGLVFLDSLGNGSLERVELRENGWSPLQELSPKVWADAPAFTVQSSSALSATWDPQRNALLLEQTVDENDDLEIVRHARGKPSVRLAPANGDDQAAAISPDGQYLAFTTARWDSLSHYDLALLKLTDGTISKLTRSDASDGPPKWSPDGRFVAFGRSNWGKKANELCVVRIVDRRLTCHAAAANISVGALGWLDDDQIVTLENDGSLSKIRLLQWSTGDVVTVTEQAGDRVSLSPDGRWVFCLYAFALHQAPAPAVFPLAAPGLIRRIALPREFPTPAFVVWLASAASAKPARVAIDSSSVRIAPVGVPIRLSAALLDDNGRSLPYRRGRIRWSVADERSARIDSISGVFVATGATPELLVRASMGTTARDSIRLRVSTDSARLAFEETWSDSGIARWIPFGRPVPTVTPVGPNRYAFLNNGDGSFSSMALSRARFDGRAGLALEFDVSARVTRAQWQSIGAAFKQGLDPAHYSRSAGRNATPLFPPATSVCELGFPEEQRAGTGGGIASFGNFTSAVHPHVPSPDWLTGSWHRIRMQLLPDGRCGLAFDGKPVGVLSSGIMPGTDIRVLIGGNSNGTRMLIGRLRVFEGVLRDIDWTGVKVF